MKPDDFDRAMNIVMTSAPPSRELMDKVLTIPQRAMPVSLAPARWSFFTWPRLASGAVVASLVLGLWLGTNTSNVVMEDEFDLVSLLSEDDGSFL
jgi:hypothetical protein